MLHQTDFDQKSKETEYSHLPVQPARLLEPGTHTAKEPEVTKIREVDGNRRDTHRDIPGAIIIVIILSLTRTQSPVSRDAEHSDFAMHAYLK